MELKVLVDNNTYIDEYYYGEPGVSYYIRDGQTKILFDVGYSGLFLQNSKKMGIDLSGLDAVVLSHGHDDHTGGLRRLMDGLRGEGSPCAERKRQECVPVPRLVCHPACFAPKRVLQPTGELTEKPTGEWLSIGMDVTQKEAADFFDLRLTKEPARISENIWFLGEIPQYYEFEQRRLIGERLVSPISDEDALRDGGDWIPDDCIEDSALVCRRESDDGQTDLFVITGCSHSGICNIVTHAERLFPGGRVKGILGGFHLSAVDERTEAATAFLEERRMEELMPCHCVSLAVKCYMSKFMPIREVGVGMALEWG